MHCHRNSAARLSSITFPNGVVSTYGYDLQGRLDNISYDLGAATLASFGYGFNAVGNITQIAEIGLTRNFTYDPLQRLTSGGTAGAPESYDYDAEGNRTTSHLSASYLTDDANRLLSDDTYTYNYDANGNLTSKTEFVGGATTTFTYDAQDQLVRIDHPDASVTTYSYDALGRRIEKDVSGTVTRYVYDGTSILLEYDGGNVLQSRYSHGNSIDQPLAVERGGSLAYYQTDHLGSVRQLTNVAGTVVNSYDYDSYGRIESAVEGVAQPFRFTGREFDAESGNYYYRARYYDPATGRFLAEDPLAFSAGDSNFYRYAVNNPTRFVDPLGLDVYVCHAPADILFGLVDHFWIKTDTTEAGMGAAAGGVPGENFDLPLNSP
jgi:RHS repeat-associated protein